MKRLLLIASLILAQSVLAQEPDSVAAHRYVPFEVGSHWQYEQWETDCSDGGCQTEITGYLDRRILGDSLVDGTRYQVMREQRYDALAQHVATATMLIRFDTTEARAFRFRPGGEEPWPDHWEFTCRLDLPAGTHDCGSDRLWAYTEVTLSFPASGAGIGMIETPSKTFDGFMCSLEFAADVGLLEQYCFENGGAGDRLRFAHVDGIEYGQQQPLSSEPTGVATAKALELFPNPAMGRVTARFSLDEPEDAVLEVFDLLGRRVAERTLPPGAHEVLIDLAGLHSGVYVVRLTGAQGSLATSRLILLN